VGGDPGRKTVLLVDDEEGFLLSLADALAAFDDWLCVLIAADGETALDLLHSHDVALLLTDIKMPGMDGFELLERARSSHPNVRTMVMTSVGSADAEARACQLGSRAYFEKPLDLDDLMASISAVLTDPETAFDGEERTADGTDQ
jgi:DNA-binding NtrC family response regulator